MAQSKSLLNDVREELECCVCQEQFSEVNEPKILKCLHTFCKNCLEKLLRQHGGAAITCPMCRQITECPNSNTSVLASNLFYKRMVEIVEAYSGRGDEGTPPCGNCEENKPLRFHCFDCNYFLCEDCAEGHKKFKALSGHHVKEIGKFKSNDYEDFARKANVCKQHKEELKFYCGQCDICICRDCAILDHRDHKFVSFEEGLEGKKSEIGAKLKKVEANGFRLKNNQQLLEKRRDKVNRSIDQATDEVHRVAEHRINLIRQHEASVTARLVDRKSRVDDFFSNQLSTVTARLMEIDSSLKFTKNVFGRNNLPEILNLEGTLAQRLQQLSMPFGETPVTNLSEVKYVPNNVFTPSDALGQLETTNTEPSLSVAEGAGLTECFQGEKSHFTVTTKDWEGQTTYSENDKIVVEIKSKKRIKDIQPNITHLKNGRYTVSYRPETVGEFEVSIKIRSQCINGSPFHLRVKQRSKNLPRKKDTTTEYCTQKVIVNEAVKSLTRKHLQRFHTLEFKYGVKVLVEKVVERIVVRGQSDDILDTMEEIHEILHQVKEEEHERSRAEMLSENVQWSCMNGGKFEEFEIFQNARIETAYEQKKIKVVIDEGGDKFEVNFGNMTMKDLVRGISTEVRRIDFRKALQLPDSWDTQPKDSAGLDTTVSLFTLTAANNPQEYNHVSGLFRQSCQQTILKIERVQNPALYETYAVRRKIMDERKGRNEKLLFHGTPGKNCDQINRKGLNRNFCGKNATMYGNGVYFATKASYSARPQYSPPEVNGLRYMYLVRVLVGEYTAGSHGLLAPPAKSPSNPTDTYDTVVDQVANPAIFVTFYDWQCYPEYLITFK